MSYKLSFYNSQGMVEEAKLRLRMEQHKPKPTKIRKIKRCENCSKETINKRFCSRVCHREYRLTIILERKIGVWKT